MSIQFSAGGVGVRSAVINFNSNDPVTPTYSFAVRCEVLVSPGFAVPELEVRLLKGPKHNCDGDHDPCSVAGKIEVKNTQFVPMNAGTIRIYGTNEDFYVAGASSLLAEIPLKRIKAGKLRKVRFKASFGGPVPQERIFIRVESTDPSGVEASYGDNQVVGIVPIL